VEMRVDLIPHAENRIARGSRVAPGAVDEPLRC
jgi:hypothetical protein